MLLQAVTVAAVVLALLLEGGAARGGVGAGLRLRSSLSSASSLQRVSPAPAPEGTVLGVSTSSSATMKRDLVGGLRYTATEADAMDPRVAKVVLEKRLPRPARGMPVEWIRKTALGRSGSAWLLPLGRSKLKVVSAVTVVPLSLLYMILYSMRVNQLVEGGNTSPSSPPQGSRMWSALVPKKLGTSILYPPVRGTEIVGTQHRDTLVSRIFKRWMGKVEIIEKTISLITKQISKITTS
jgi:hypothetical protein